MNTELLSIESRARVHAALGDPNRLAIVDGLAIGDASPGEISSRLAMPSNLVAHHVNVLAEAGVVDRVRSEHDRRRSYLRLNPGVMTMLRQPSMDPPKRVVFVCTHNSARSQLAAARFAELSTIPVTSAGTQPATRIHPRAVRTARRHGLHLASSTRLLEDVAHDGDLVVAVCDHIHETLPPELQRLHWSVPDPVKVDTDEAFESAYADLSGRIDRLAPSLTAGGTR
jgi:protein-tyrosine-phosphatase/DNA-binding transcriptional ArsR family regulator